MGKELHPKVREFKDFINKHPELLVNIRKSGKSWQYYYDKWVLNGENDPMWQKYMNENEQEPNSENHSKLFEKIIQLTQNIDVNKVQKQVSQLDSTINSIQKMLHQFLESQNQKQNSPPNQFNWFRD